MITTNDMLIFGGMVFTTVLFLALALIIPTAGTAAQANRRMRRRMAKHIDINNDGAESLYRSNYMESFSPLARSVERWGIARPFRHLIGQAGLRVSVLSLFMRALIPAVLLVLLGFLFQVPLLGLAAAAVVLFLPYVYLSVVRDRRMQAFEAQLPPALDIISRALRAGHPFNETLRLVAEEMDDPIAGEFGRTYSDMNFGAPMKVALQGMLVRVPSLSLQTLITAVIIQHESGGKLAEIVEKIAAVIRSRFKLQRKIRTLSAEGRLSAWVLALVPIVLAIVLSLTSPDYLPVMLGDELGRRLIVYAFIGMLLGILWMRKIIRIEV